MGGNADVFKDNTQSATTDTHSGVVDPKKAAVTPADHHDDPNHHDDATAGPQPNKLEQEGALCWSDPSSWSNLFTEGKNLVSNIFGGSSEKKPEVYQTVDNIGTLTCNDIFKETKATATTDQTKPAADTTSSTSGIGDWFNNMGKAVSDIGSKITGKVTSAMDWIFSKDSPEGGQTTVSAKNGEAHVTGKDKNGTKVDVTDNKHTVEGDVGVAHILSDKDTKKGDYKSGTYDVHVEPGLKRVTDEATHQTIEWNSKENKGTITDKDGKVIMTFDSPESLKSQITQKLTDKSQLTQTNAPADATADKVAKDMKSGDIPNQTRYIVDNKGNTAIVREDGLIIKTYKEDGRVTIEKDGHMIKIQNHHAMALQDGKWVELKGNVDLPGGVNVNADGSVAVKGKTVVTKDGNVQADTNTKVDTTTGQLTTTSDTGGVTVTNNDGKTQVRHGGCGDIENDGHRFRQLDKNCPTFQGWDPESGGSGLQIFGGANGSGISIDTTPGGRGDLVITEPNGQKTTMNEDGSIFAFNSDGSSIFSLDSAGDVGFFDGTKISADGTVSNQYGSGSAWDEGGAASAEISEANAAVSVAAGAINNYLPDTGALGALDGELSDLSSLAQVYTATGQLDVVAQLSSAASTVQAARAALEQRIAAADTSQNVLGTQSPELTAMIVQSGLPPEIALRMLAEKGVITDPSQDTTAA